MVHPVEAVRDARTGTPARASSLALVGLALGMLLAVLDQTIVATALPSIAADLGHLDDASWVVSAYLLTTLLSAPLYGKLGDMYGRRPMFLTTVAIFLVGSAACGLARNMGQLVVLRAIQGLGGGGLMNLGTAAVADLIPPTERGRIQGYTGGVFAAGSIGGPLLGGLFSEYLGWHWIFYINVPVCVLSLALTGMTFRVPHTRRRGALDVTGALLLGIAVTCGLLVALWGGQRYPWRSGHILVPAAAAVALIAGFVWRERRAAEPILPPRLFANPVFRVAIPSSALLGVCLFGTVVFLPQFFETVRHSSPTGSGLFLVPTMLAAVFGGVLSGVLASETGRYRRYPIAGATLLMVGFGLLTQISTNTSVAWLVVDMVILGLGVGLQMQLMVFVVQNAVPHEDVGVATAATMFFRAIGAAVGTSLFTTILLRRLGAELAGSGTNPSAARVGELYRRLTEHSPALSGEARDRVVEAFADSIHVLFAWALPFGALLLALAIVLPAVPLRRTVRDSEPGPTAHPAPPELRGDRA
jgi:EmrB/QacA subfamily drug resistance transporter